MKSIFPLVAVLFVIAAMSAVSASDSAYTGASSESSKSSASTNSTTSATPSTSTNSPDSARGESSETPAGDSPNFASLATNAPSTNAPSTNTSSTSAPTKKKKKKTSSDSTSSSQPEAKTSSNSGATMKSEAKPDATAKSEIKPKESAKSDTPKAKNSSTPASAASSSTNGSSADVSSSTGKSSSDTSSGGSTTATLSIADLKEYADLSPEIQALIRNGLALTRMGLRYQYGSCDPKNGGMDCSGTVYYLLQRAGIKSPPRDAGEIYTWVWKQGHIEPVASSSLGSFELSRLKPGDLLFWTGTYDIQRDPPISHVMIYLGTDRRDGHKVMLGASDGRRYQGKSQYGVSVFDFILPKVIRKSDGTTVTREREGRFIGYGPIPGLSGA